jgi:hypothetical protein
VEAPELAPPELVLPELAPLEPLELVLPPELVLPEPLELAAPELAPELELPAPVVPVPLLPEHAAIAAMEAMPMAAMVNCDRIFQFPFRRTASQVSSLIPSPESVSMVWPSAETCPVAATLRTPTFGGVEE